MRRLVSLLGCTALLGGGLTVALASSAASGDFQPATISATAEFVCSEESVTVNWTLAVSDTPDGATSDITSANASPDFGAVTFTPAADLEDGDAPTGSSTHASDTTDVALSVEFTTAIVGANSADGETTVELPVECPPEEPPPPPVVEDPPVVAPDFTG